MKQQNKARDRKNRQGNKKRPYPRYRRDKALFFTGAGGRSRTDMDVNPLDFESSASTSFTTPAWDVKVPLVILQHLFCCQAERAIPLSSLFCFLVVGRRSWQQQRRDTGCNCHVIQLKGTDVKTFPPGPCQAALINGYRG